MRETYKITITTASKYGDNYFNAIIYPIKGEKIPALSSWTGKGAYTYPYFTGDYAIRVYQNDTYKNMKANIFIYSKSWEGLGNKLKGKSFYITFFERNKPEYFLKWNEDMDKYLSKYEQ